jgi:hypothetical protein
VPKHRVSSSIARVPGKLCGKATPDVHPLALRLGSQAHSKLVVQSNAEHLCCQIRSTAGRVVIIRQLGTANGRWSIYAYLTKIEKEVFTSEDPIPTERPLHSPANRPTGDQPVRAGRADRCHRIGHTEVRQSEAACPIEQ